MEVIFNLNNVNELGRIKDYANAKGISVDSLIDEIIKRFSIKLNQKEEENTCSPEEIYNARLEKYKINEFIKDRLKFTYFIHKDGTVSCIQFKKIKNLNFSFDSSSGDFFVYVLLEGCPNKADIATLQQHSLRLSVEEIYDKVYGHGSFEKYAMKNVMKKVEESQAEWKKKNGKAYDLLNQEVKK